VSRAQTGIRVWLDNHRQPDDPWVWVKSPDDAIRLLEQENVTLISFDHDLGFEGERESTGYQMLLSIEEAVALPGPRPAADAWPIGQPAGTRAAAARHRSHPPPPGRPPVTIRGPDMLKGGLPAHLPSAAATSRPVATPSSGSPITTVIKPRPAQRQRPPALKSAADWKRQLANVRPRLRIVR
jgi:Cyclic-phosphate processing Receiver domain